MGLTSTLAVLMWLFHLVHCQTESTNQVMITSQMENTNEAVSILTSEYSTANIVLTDPDLTMETDAITTSESKTTTIGAGETSTVKQTTIGADTTSTVKETTIGADTTSTDKQTTIGADTTSTVKETTYLPDVTTTRDVTTEQVLTAVTTAMTTPIATTTTDVVKTSTNPTVTDTEHVTTTPPQESCECDELFWILLLGIGLGVPLIGVIIALVLVILELRKAKKRLFGGSKYLTSTRQDIAVMDSDATNNRTVLQGPRERSGIDSYVNASYVDDDEFDEPLYTNRFGVESGQAMTSFTNPHTYHTDGAAKYEEDTTRVDHDEQSQDGVEGIYVNNDVLRHLAGRTKPPNRRIRTIDPRQTYVNTGDILSQDDQTYVNTGDILSQDDQMVFT